MTLKNISLKRMAYMKFAGTIVAILLSGRIMLSDPNIVYRYIGTFAFIGFNARAMLLALYMQYRGSHNWSESTDADSK